MLRLLARARTQQSARISAIHTMSKNGFHAEYNAAKEEQTFKLSDGRTIGFAEYGNLDGLGVPTFFFHGCPGSRYDGAAMLKVAKKLNLHVVCPDRPGFGLSTVSPGHKLGDYPSDIRQLASRLGFSRYHVFGISGGGPYAIACARFIPSGELLSTNVIAGGGHPDTLSLKNTGWWGLSMSYLGRYTPGLMSWAINLAKAKDPEFREAASACGGMMTKLSDDDKAELQDPEILALNMATMKAAYTQGAAGVLQDIRLMDGKWDFELRDVENKVKLFYGRKDVHTPLALGQHYLQHLQNAELIEYEEASHITIFRRDEDIFRNALGLEDS